MNRTEHLLTTLAEECGEVAQRCTKALRFSLSEIQPGQQFTNAERILHEYADVAGILDILMKEKILKLPDDYMERVNAKKERFEKYLKISEKQGTLT